MARIARFNGECRYLRDEVLLRVARAKGVSARPQPQIQRIHGYVIAVIFTAFAMQLILWDQ